MTRGVRSGSEVWPPRFDGRRRARPAPAARPRDVDMQCIPIACANFGGDRRGSKNKGLASYPGSFDPRGATFIFSRMVRNDMDRVTLNAMPFSNTTMDAAGSAASPLLF
eukprot:353608-Chlamydomonas_euryale.AAC.1